MADFFAFIKESDMFSRLIQSDLQQQKAIPKEGDLYKVVNIHGRSFELRYGYYEECDRQSPLCQPVVIYPDFIQDPVYTDDGTPFVTMMQDACPYFKGEKKRTADSTCDECKYFKHGDDWFGICTCPKNKLAD